MQRSGSAFSVTTLLAGSKQPNARLASDLWKVWTRRPYGHPVIA